MRSISTTAPPSSRAGSYRCDVAVLLRRDRHAQSVHSFGQRAKAAVERPRRQVAELIMRQTARSFSFRAAPKPITCLCVARGSAWRHGRHIITTKIEHPAVLATCEYLEQSGFRITYLPVSNTGRISVDDLHAALTVDTILVSVMHANNETGTIQPIEEIAQVVAAARDRGAAHLHFHSDAVQSAGKVAIDVKKLMVDLLSVSAHSSMDPRASARFTFARACGCRALYAAITSETGGRTENVPGIVEWDAQPRSRANGSLRAGTDAQARDHLERRSPREFPTCELMETPGIACPTSRT